MRIKSLKLKQIGGVCLLSLGIFLTPFPSIAVAVQESPIPQLYSEGWGTLVAQTGSEMRETQYNIGHDVDLNNLTNRVDKLEKTVQTLKNNKKDFWDKFNILASFVTVAVFGVFYKHMESKREKQHNDFEEKIAEINAQVKQAELISRFMEALVSDNYKTRTLAVKAISLALPKEAPVLVKLVSEDDPNPQVRNIAEESVKILLNNVVTNKYELFHLYMLYEAQREGKPYKVTKREPFLKELRHLRSLGLIENKRDKTIAGMPYKGDLRDSVKLTDKGNQHVEDREKYGLYNPRRKANTKWWDSVIEEIKSSENGIPIPATTP